MAHVSRFNVGIKIVKFIENQYNKAFVLSMNTGEELIAKLPNPNAGPAEPLNSVGAEYIIEEKAVGSPLGWHWHDIPMKSRVDIVDQIVGVERRLMSIDFSMHGCVYYRTDLKRMSQRYAPLDKVLLSSGLTPELNHLLPCFALGPLNDPKVLGRRAGYDGAGQRPM